MAFSIVYILLFPFFSIVLRAVCHAVSSEHIQSVLSPASIVPHCSGQRIQLHVVRSDFTPCPCLASVSGYIHCVIGHGYAVIAAREVDTLERTFYLTNRCPCNAKINRLLYSTFTVYQPHNGICLSTCIAEVGCGSICISSVGLAVSVASVGCIPNAALTIFSLDA